jgi:hypothetical protein
LQNGGIILDDCVITFLRKRPQPLKKHNNPTIVPKERRDRAEICNVKKWILNYKLEVIGAGIGALMGWFYWQFVGCASGACAITSNPIYSTVYGLISGSLILGLFKKKTKGETTSTKK